VPVLIVIQRRRFGIDRAVRLVGLMLLVDFALLFVLFFLTTASAWAQDFTSANRLILQLVPSVIVLAALLLRPIEAVAAMPSARDRARTSLLPIDRA
jgi:Ca2+/H+ antiporter